MEIYCANCGRLNKIEYRDNNEDSIFKKRIGNCAYCGTGVIRVEDNREVYAIEWDD